MISFNSWTPERLATLVAEDGWLNLTDRVDIPTGPQNLGRAADNDLVLSVGPDHLGVLTATAQSASLQVAGQDLSFAAQDGNPMLRVLDLMLELHTVEGQPALRVRDLALPRTVALSSYPFDPAWVINVKWEALATAQAQLVDQKGAVSTEVTLTHRAHFTRDGQDVTLLATH